MVESLRIKFFFKSFCLIFLIFLIMLINKEYVFLKTLGFLGKVLLFIYDVLGNKGEVV